jgi:hypothetical protein
MPPTVSGSTTLLQCLFNGFPMWQGWAGDQQEVPGLDTDRNPDPPNWCLSDRIRIHNTAATFVQRFPLWQVWAGDQQEVPGLLEAGQKADRGPQNILARALEHAAKNDTLNISKTKRLGPSQYVFCLFIPVVSKNLMFCMFFVQMENVFLSLSVLRWYGRK